MGIDFIARCRHNVGMTAKIQLLQVAVPAPLRRLFDYLPNDDVLHWQVGQRVHVPFGRRSLVGVIVALPTQSDFPIEKLKKVDASIDQHPLLTEAQLKLAYWVSDYYQHPIGDVILGVLPKKIRQGKVLDILDQVDQKKFEEILPNFSLTPEQDTAIATINNATGFQAFLLAGVTGSGKTEVYLRVIAAVLKQQKQALVLVPEIALTPQTVARFQARFSVPVLLLHSGLSESKRLKAWLQATNDQPCIVIGTRSAVFAPLKNCGVIVVDEEHDLSFKQQSGLRYSARDVAVMRAKLSDIPIILGSATPALESWYNVKQKKYQLLSLSNRAGSANLPTITAYDLCKQTLKNGLSDALIKTMRRHLSYGHQVLVFLNRRGYAPVMLCHQCGWSASCRYCDARLTVHHQPSRLLCHHCGFQMPLIRTCQSCRQSELIALGMGTEQLEKTLREIFPDKQICRVDRDNVRTFSALEKTLASVHNKEVDILIGTQMLVKGHHFENVSLVAAVDVDNGLFSADFRAIERLGQSLIQVAGRAGRASIAGEVFIQTHHPNHPLLRQLFQEGYFVFADTVLKERLQAQLPPAKHMVLLRAEASSEQRVHDFLIDAKKQLGCGSHAVELLGPLPAIMAKKAGVYRAQLFLQAAHRRAIHHALSIFLESVEIKKKWVGVRWMIDVDPMEV